jgi:hypothetical protein
MCVKSIWLIGFFIWLTAAEGCSAGPPNNFTEERLRSRISLAWSYFVNGKFEAYIAMWSARMRPRLRESEEDWQKSVQQWRVFITNEKPAFELIDLKITRQRARVTMRVSALEKDGSRSSNAQYDYWVFENGDWFLDDAGRTK